MSIADQIHTLEAQAKELENRAKNGDKTAGQGAIKAYEEATKLAEQYYGRIHEYTLNLLEQYVDNVRSFGTLAQATTCHLKNVERTSESVEQHQRMNAPKDELEDAQTRHLDAQRLLAETYLEDKKFSEAIKLYEEIWNTKVKRPDEERYEDGENLTSALFETKIDCNIMRAAQLSFDLLREAEQKLGKGHIETVKIRFNLAKDLYSLGKYNDASEKYAELLRILEAPDCRAKDSPKYDYYLKGTKNSLRHCAVRIAHQKEEEGLQILQKKRRTEEVRKEVGKQIVAKGSVSQNENETIATASRREKKHHEKQPKQEPVQNTKTKYGQMQPPDVRFDPRADQHKRTSSHLNEAAHFDQSLKQNANVPGPSNWKAASNQESSKARSKSTTELMQGMNARAQAEVKRDVPTRPRSASAALDPHRSIEASSQIMQRSHSARSEKERSNNNATRGETSVHSKTWVAEARSKRQQDLPPLSSIHETTQQGAADQRTTTPRVEDWISSSSLRREIATQEKERKTDTNARGEVTDPIDQSISKQSISSLQSKKENENTLVRIPSSAPQSTKRAQHVLSVPSILLSAPIHRDKKRSLSNGEAESSRQTIKEMARPKSSQSNYSTSASFSRTAEKRESQSRSKDANQTPLSLLKASKELEGVLKRVPNVVESANKSDAEAQRRLGGASRKISSEKPGRDINTSTESSRSVHEAPKTPNVISIPTGVEAQELHRPVETSKYAKATDPDNSEPRKWQEQARYTTSTTEHERNKASRTAGLEGTASAISTNTSHSGEAKAVIPDAPIPNQKIRRVRSNDTLSQGSLRIPQTSEAGHKRAASVDISRSSIPARGAQFTKDWSSVVENLADNWFVNLRKNAHRILDEYRNDCYGVTKTARRVRIAVLDTGVARSSSYGSVQPILKSSRVKPGKVLHPSLPWNIDSKGHGTHAVGLVITVCPYADVYVYRVCEGSSHIDKNLVADAILDAVDKNKVDIISMSLGWEDNSHIELRQAVRHARAADVLLFAATSNEGVQAGAGMAFPARASEVIAVDAATVYNHPLESNPQGANQKQSGRLTALGQAVKSTWPTNLPTDYHEMGWKRLAGTSCATPILAGVAGLVLEFARQRPLCFEHAIEKHLKTVEGMHLVLKDLLCVEHRQHRDHNFLVPDGLFSIAGQYQEGSHWAEPSTPRFDAVSSILKVLRKEFGPDIGSVMYKEIERLRSEQGEGWNA